MQIKCLSLREQNTLKYALKYPLNVPEVDQVLSWWLNILITSPSAAFLPLKSNLESRALVQWRRCFLICYWHWSREERLLQCRCFPYAYKDRRFLCNGFWETIFFISLLSFYDNNSHDCEVAAEISFAYRAPVKTTIVCRNNVHPWVWYKNVPFMSSINNHEIPGKNGCPGGMV